MKTNFERGGWQSEKIQAHHQDRLAIVYVRQSTWQQVLDHQESTRIQDGLAQRAEAWGWSAERILTIDEDLGKSGSSAEGRSGFQRLVSEVGLNHVGLILGVEMSRLARCSKDWHQLLEICALFGTFIADLDGIYDPSQYNDRLLLGLKGTMSEAELHILKQRLVQGKYHKAERGELGFHVPIGYVRRPSGEVRFAPDEQAQQVVRLIFRKFEELGTLNAVLCYLVKQQIQIGVRVLSGCNKGDLEWRRPNRPTLQNLLKHPAYAGAYAYGRSQIDPRRKQAGRPYTGQVVKPPEDWLVLIQDHHPADITWEQYERNQAQLKANQNRADELGHVRSGNALLTGLLVCHKCGCRMSVQYHQNDLPRYICCRAAADYGGRLCPYLSGHCLDEYVTEQVLRALEPVALELSLEAITHLEHDRAELDHLWQKRLERADFEAQRAKRHYQLVEPENRLVARQLAQEWEATLKEQQQLQEEYKRFTHQQPKILSTQEQQMIRQIAESLPTLWHSSTTTQAQRKEIIRQVIQQIKVDVQDQSEWVQVSIEWVGGMSTQAQIMRPVARWTQLSHYPQLCQRLAQFAQTPLTSEEIARCLNQEGFYPPKRCKHIQPEEVNTLMRRLGLRTRRVSVAQEPLPEHEWWLPELANVLQMPVVTLYNWVRRGWVKAHQQPTPPRPWIVWADAAELERLKAHRQRPAGEMQRQRWQGEIPTLTLPPTGGDLP
jgi:DNA invertase Pin-like site-specific DNA recombinase